MKKIKKKLIRIIKRDLKSKSLITKKKIGIAVSGGIDSMVLLDLFCNLKKTVSFEIYVLHYNHKWRNESYKDAELIKKYCRLNHLKFIYKEDKNKTPTKSELEAREKRYNFFQKIAQEKLLNFICTAHHKDDQLETIIFRLLRGTGPLGMQPVKNILEYKSNTLLYRPLLEFTKDEIYKYARENKVQYNEDRTNKDLRHSRNLIRKKIIPLFRKINTKALNNIFLFSDIVFSQQAALDQYFSSILSKKISTKSLHVKSDRFLEQDESIQKAFIYWFLSKHELKGNLLKINLILNAIKQSKKMDLSKEYFFIATNKEFYLEKKHKLETSDVPSRKSESFIINENSKKQLQFSDLIFELKPFPGKLTNNAFPADSKKIAFADFSKFKNKNLTVRFRNSSDIIQPLGATTNCKLKKYMINKKIPRSRRYRIPLLCFNNEILWLPGYALSNKLRVKKKPTHLLKIYEKR